MASIHIYKNTEGRFECCIIKHGKYITGTRQGYENKADAIQVIRILSEATLSDAAIPFQDNTKQQPVICVLEKNGSISTHENIKPGPRYIPQ